MKSIPDTTNIAGSTSILVNGGIVKQLAVLNESRRSILLTNKGVSYPVYLGISSNTTSGSSGANFTYISTGDIMRLGDYSGPLYGIHAGASGTYEQIGVLDIG